MFMSMYGEVHPKSDVGRTYMSKEWGKEDFLRMEESNLAWYLKISVEQLTKGVKNAEIMEYDNTVNKD